MSASNNGAVPIGELEDLDSEVRHLRERQAEDRIELRDVDNRVRAVEIAVSALGREVKIWGTILAALLVAVLTTVVTK